MPLPEWIHKARELGASDLHVEADGPVIARVRGTLKPLGETSSAVDLQRTSEELLGAAGWAGFLSRGSADVSLALAVASTCSEPSAASPSRSACWRHRSRTSGPATCIPACDD